jgi:DNA-binding response OmpR family regulator
MTTDSPAPSIVLFVDDEPGLRNLGRAILERAGYKVLEASDGLAALEVLRHQRGRIALVILDLAMPRLTGEETFRALQKIDQDVAVVFASGDVMEETPGDEHNQIAGFVAKPYRPRELAAMVRAVLQQREAGLLVQEASPLAPASASGPTRLRIVPS